MGPLQPISAQPVFVKRKIRAVKQNTPDQITNVPGNATVQPTRVPNFISRFRRSPSPNALQSNVTNEKQPSSPSTPNYRVRVEMLQVAVFIAMPSPNRSQRKNHILDKTDPDPDDESDDELPNIVFGVTRVNFRQPKSIPSPTLPPLQPEPT